MANQGEIITVQEKLGANPYQVTGQTYPSNPSVGNTYTYVSPRSVSPYKLMDDCYDGMGHVQSGEYLVPFNREGHYYERRETSAYKNFIKPLVRALIDPVFVEEAPRVITDEAGNETENLMANTFIEDVDNDGMPMQEFTEDIVTTARIHGVCFCLVDNFSEEEQPVTAQQAIEMRIMPYLIKKTAQEVESWRTDDFGRLTEIMFCEEPIIRDGKIIRRARKWTSEYSVLMELVTKELAGKTTQEWVEVGAPVMHNLGMIPVVTVYFNKKSSKKVILVNPPMYDLALLNLVIWNKESEVRDLERAQAFSLLTIQTDNVTSVTVGPKNALIVPMNATIAPAYISPDSSILKVLVENVTAHREDLFRMAEQQGVYGVRSEASGVSLAWKFFGQEAQLKRTSKAATVFEDSVMELFQLWTGEEFTYVVQYPADFQPGDVTAELGNYKTALAFPGVTTKMRQKLLEKTARLLFGDEDADEVAEIIEDIYAEQEAQPVAPTPALTEPPEEEEPEDEPEEE